MTATETGRRAENVAADYLRGLGYEIVARNWKTRVCEIDIVARKNNCAYFVEVKYRARDQQGGGLEYITAKKQQQMRFAADMWCAENQWNDDMALAGIEVSGNFEVTDFIDSIY